MQLRKRIESLRATSEEEARRHSQDVEELQQRIQTMIDEAATATEAAAAAANKTETIASAAGVGGGEMDRENKKLKQEVATANITIEFLQQQLAQLRQDHSKQHSNLKNVITQLEHTSGYKSSSGGETSTGAAIVAANSSSVSSTVAGQSGDNLVVAVVKCLGSLVDSVKRCIQRVLDYLHDL